MANQTEGAGANRHGAGIELLGGGVGVGLTVQDIQVGEVHRQQRVGAVGGEADGQRVHHLDPGDGSDETGKTAGAIGHLGDAGEGEGHIIGSEGVAIVKAHTGAQAEFPGIGRDRAPAQRQARAEHAIGVILHQLTEDHAGGRVVGGELMEMRVEAGDRRAHRHGQSLRLGARQTQRQPKGREYQTHVRLPA